MWISQGGFRTSLRHGCCWERGRAAKGIVGYKVEHNYFRFMTRRTAAFSSCRRESEHGVNVCFNFLAHISVIFGVLVEFKSTENTLSTKQDLEVYLQKYKRSRQIRTMITIMEVKGSEFTTPYLSNTKVYLAQTDV